jgi:hypothetical protein
LPALAAAVIFGMAARTAPAGHETLGTLTARTDSYAGEARPWRWG